MVLFLNFYFLINIFEKSACTEAMKLELRSGKGTLFTFNFSKTSGHTIIKPGTIDNLPGVSIRRGVVTSSCCEDNFLILHF